MKKSLITPQSKLAEGNPFYGMKATLAMLQQGSKMTDNPSKAVVQNMLDQAWRECKDDADKRRLFWSVVFSFGDITNREHNIFRKKKMKNVDPGGQALRKLFLYCLEWTHRTMPEQFYKFLPVIGEYYNLGGIIQFNILWTDRFKGTVKEQFRIGVDKERLTDYIASVLNNPKTSDIERKLWAKWLWHIPSTRLRKFVVTEKGLKSAQKKYDVKKVGDTVKYTGKKKPHTLAKEKEMLECISLLSKKMDWEVSTTRGFTEYKGYKRFKAMYIKDTEAYLFSTQKIREMDEATFIDWIDVQPSGARYNVQRRLFNTSKDGKMESTKRWMNHQGKDLATFYTKWMNAKEKAQQDMRNLSDDDKAKLKKEDPSKLKQMEKNAKVNTGAESLLDIVTKLFKGGNKQELDAIAHSIMEKVKIDVPVLVTTDTSGSMGSHFGHKMEHKGITFTPIQVAHLAITTFLLKNPDPELRDMFITFHSTANVVMAQQTVNVKGQNKFMSTRSATVPWVTDRTKSFIENYRNISSIVNTPGGVTRFDTVSAELKRWVDSEPLYKDQRIEQILKYPVFLVISDGDFNGQGGPEQTLLAFQQNMRQWFGWEGLVVVWDVKSPGGDNYTKFDGIPNAIYYGGFNASILNQIFLNIDDLDIIDIYTTLLSMARSNRYEPVRALVM
jgi:hypothetical protein